MQHEDDFLFIVRWSLRSIFPLMIVLTAIPTSWAFFNSTSIVSFVVFLIGILGSSWIWSVSVVEWYTDSDYYWKKIRPEYYQKEAKQ